MTNLQTHVLAILIEGKGKHVEARVVNKKLGAALLVLGFPSAPAPGICFKNHTSH
jgi:hypothetical protein